MLLVIGIVITKNLMSMDSITENLLMKKLENMTLEEKREEKLQEILK